MTKTDKEKQTNRDIKKSQKKKDKDMHRLRQTDRERHRHIERVGERNSDIGRQT